MTGQKRGNPEKNASTPSGKRQRGSSVTIPPMEKDKFGFGISPVDTEVEKVLLSPLNGIPLHQYVNLKVAKMFELIKVES
jgi:hypothetical protein